MPSPRSMRQADLVLSQRGGTAQCAKYVILMIERMNQKELK